MAEAGGFGVNSQRGRGMTRMTRLAPRGDAVDHGPVVGRFVRGRGVTRPDRGYPHAPRGLPREAGRWRPDGHSGGFRSSAAHMPAPRSVPTGTGDDHGVPPVLRDRRATIEHWRKTFVYRVSEQNNTRIRTLLQVATQIVPPGDAGVNPHELLAVARTRATVYGLAELALTHDVIDIRFHAQRDKGIVKSLINALVREGHGTHDDPLITVNFRDGHVVARDVLRRPDADVVKATATAVLFIDVYHGFTDEGNVHEFTPDDLWFYGQMYQEGLWIGHQFHGAFGTLDTACWYRGDDGIHWKPDDVNPEYPAHPPCDGLFSSGGDGGHAWSVGQTWQLEGKVLYVAVRAKPSAVRAPTIVDKPSGTGIVELDIADLLSVQYRLERWLGRSLAVACGKGLQMLCLSSFAIDGLIARKRVFVSKKHLISVGQHVTQRGCTAWSYSSTNAYVANLLNNDLDHQRLFNAFPERFMSYQHDLVLAGFCNNVRERSQELVQIRQSYGADFASINYSRANIDKPLSSGSFTVPLLLIAAGFCSYVLTRFLVSRAQNRIVSGLSKLSVSLRGLVDNARPAAGFNPALFRFGMVVGDAVITDIITTPIIEEGIKRMLPNHWWKILSSSAIALADVRRFHGDANMLIRHVALHLVFAYMPTYTMSVLTHCAYNAVVCWRAIRSVFEEDGDSLQFNGQSLWGTPCAGRFDLSELSKLLTGDSSRGSIVDGVLQGPERGVITEAVPGELFGPLLENITEDEVFLPAVISTKTDSVRVDPSVEIISGALGDYEDEETPPNNQGYYRAIALEVPMYRPATCGHNLRMVIKYRLMKDVSYLTDYGSWRRAHNIIVNAPIGIYSPDLEVWDREVNYINWRNRADVYEASTDDVPFSEVMGTEEWLYKIRLVEGMSQWYHYPTQQQMLSWLEHTEAEKRRRYEASIQRVLDNPIRLKGDTRVTSIPIIIKNDEVLMKPDFAPRPIHNVDTDLIVTVGPIVYECTKRMMDDWWFKIILVDDTGTKNKVLTLTWGAGRTSDELDNWLNIAIVINGIHIIVAGDDIFVVGRIDDMILWWELDLTQCDHTNRGEALENEYCFLLRYGSPLQTVRWLSQNASANLLCGLRQADRGRVKLSRGMERNTGGVDTTFGNTVNVGTCVTAVFFENWDTLSNPSVPTSDMRSVIDLGAAMFGFEMKTKVSKGPIGDYLHGIRPMGTFLKGIWLPCYHAQVPPPECRYPSFDRDYPFKITRNTAECAFAWTPVLGRLVKLTKTLRHPPTIYRLPGEVSISMKVGLTRHMVSTAKSMAPFSLLLPVRQWFETFGTDEERLLIGPAPIEAHKVQPGSARELDESRSIAALSGHYECDPVELQGWLYHLYDCGVMTRSRHPFWCIVARRDYA